MATPPAGNDEWGPPTLKDLVANYERTLILQALTAAHGNRRRAAALLGVLPTTLLQKMKRLGIRPSSKHGCSPGDVGLDTN